MSGLIEEMKEQNRKIHLKALAKVDELNPVEDFCKCSHCQDERDRRRREECGSE